MVEIRLKRQPNSDDDRAARFARCLLARIRIGASYEEPDEPADEAPEWLEVVFVRATLTESEAKKQIVKVAPECDENWRELYDFPSDPA